MLGPRFMGEEKVLSVSFKSRNSYSRMVTVSLLCRIWAHGWLG